MCNEYEYKKEECETKRKKKKKYEKTQYQRAEVHWTARKHFCIK